MKDSEASVAEEEPNGDESPQGLKKTWLGASGLKRTQPRFGSNLGDCTLNAHGVCVVLNSVWLRRFRARISR